MSGEIQIIIPPPTFKPVNGIEEEYPIGIFTQKETQASNKGEEFLSRLHMPVYFPMDDLATPCGE